jgi:hypothetical protein
MSGVNGTEAEAPMPAAGEDAPKAQPRRETRLKVDASDLKSSYCNVCNASSTREEMVINFGVNHDWDRGQAGADVRLLHRIILSPYAAKRVAELLGKLVGDYESKYGELK